MLELKINCESVDEVNIYANAVVLHNLLGDLRNALRNAYKHNTETEVLRVINGFYPDITKAVEHSQGPY